MFGINILLQRLATLSTMLLIMVSTDIQAGTQTTTLQELKWSKRIIAVFGSETSSEFRALRDWLAEHQCESLQRDLLVFHIREDLAVDMTNSELTLDADSVSRLVQLQGEPDNAIELVLIGKDGTLKARADSATEMDTLIHLIDRMPMRRQEMSADSTVCRHD